MNAKPGPRQRTSLHSRIVLRTILIPRSIVNIEITNKKQENRRIITDDCLIVNKKSKIEIKVI